MRHLRDLSMLFEKLQPCLMGNKACASAHCWSRELKVFRHPGAVDIGSLREVLRQTAKEQRC